MNNKYMDLGLLILRVGIGAMFIYHGLPKMMGGVQAWTGLGKAMESVGIGFAPQFWGFMSAFAELFGGICLILGIFFQPFCALLFINLAVASIMHLRHGDGLAAASHAIELGILFLSLFFIGPGKYRIGKF